MKINKNNKIEEKLDEILLRLQESENILTFSDACKYLCVSESTLYKLTSFRKIEYYKPNGKMIYFSKVQLNSYIKSRKVLKKTEKYKLSKPKAGMKAR
ncbi:MAG: helix-turn-helix domain-containing protein [Candidatus Kapaibacterium sp.]